MIIIDTSNEISGPDDIPNAAVGASRRMMVPEIDKQYQVMQESVRNHNPDVVVIDELANRVEAKAVDTIRRRGVKVFASVHGSFTDLVNNEELNRLLGGFQDVIFSDSSMNNGGEGRKTRPMRVGEPVFDVIVELGSNDDYRIIRDVKYQIDN